MSHQILICPHHVLDPVQAWMTKNYNVNFVTLNEFIRKYVPGHDQALLERARKMGFPEASLFGFPSWFRKSRAILKQVFLRTLESQLHNYGPIISAMDEAFQCEPISLILISNDATAGTRALTFMGNKYDVPSLHVDHGFPIRAFAHSPNTWVDKLAVYGEGPKAVWSSIGTPVEKMVVTGNPYWDHLRPPAEETIDRIKEDLKLDAQKKILLFAPPWYCHFNPILDDPESLERRDLRILLSELEKLGVASEIELIVKLHPGFESKKTMYDQELRKRPFPYRIFTDSLLPLLQASDVILCSGSTVIESLLIGKTPIFYECGRFCSALDFDYCYSHHFTKKNAPFYVALTPDDLSYALARSLRGVNDFSKGDVEKFLLRTNSLCDGKATERVSELAMRMIQEKKQAKFVSPVSYKKREAYYSHMHQDIAFMVEGNPLKVLEIGCSEGRLGEFIKRKYPHCEYIGVEINADAADQARKRIDKVIVGDIEKMDLRTWGIEDQTIDCIIYADVLEHLYDPWTVLNQHKDFLKDTGQVITSIPNIRNLEILESLMNGNWTYKSEGILDSTHLRFFTIREIKSCFSDCGYEVLEIKNVSSNLFDLNKLSFPVNIDFPKFTIKNIGKEEAIELSTVQFIVKAQKGCNLLRRSEIDDRRVVAEQAGKKLHEAVKCSIIIPVFNKAALLERCLERIVQNTELDYEIILVDDASQEEELIQFYKTSSFKFKLLKNPANLGFTRSCNIGAKEAKGEYLVFLNSDTEPQKGWLREMVRTMEEDKKTGIVGSKLLYPESDILQHGGVAFAENGVPYHPGRGLREAEFPEGNQVREAEAVTGACFLVPKRLFEESGGFDENYKSGLEDVDLCLRIRDLGYKVIYNPGSVVYHHENASLALLGYKGYVEESYIRYFLSKWGARIKGGKFFTRSSPERKAPVRDSAVKPEDYYQLGEASLSIGRFQEALNFYDEALALDPSNVMAWRRCGELLERDGQMDLACQMYLKALKIDPGFQEAKEALKSALSKKLDKVSPSLDTENQRK